jgi:signal transduction histidine kinase
MSKSARPSSKPGKIPFRMHPRVFAALGADLVTNDVVAIIELVKNSYDALATRVDVRFRYQNGLESICIEVEDNGDGMTRSIIEDVWCVVATPYRMTEPVSKRGQRTRRVSGEKGLGRLSTARLGNRLETITKSDNEPCWQVNVDWSGLAEANNLESCEVEIFEYTAKPSFGRHGTLVRISDLHSSWDSSKLTDLREQLSRLVSPFHEIEDFGIRLTLPGEEAEPTEIQPPDFILNPPYLIKGHVDDSGAVRCTYRYAGTEGTKERSIKRSLWTEPDTVEDSGTDAQNNTVPSCGPFDFEIRAWDIDSDSILEIAERFNIPRSTIRKDIKNYKGISVYRDEVLVLPKSESARDWLGLDLRRVSRVGTRLSTSQIIGYVAITAEKNPQLKDTSDRERFVDNTAAKDFKQLLKEVVHSLEVERDKDRQEATHKEPPLKDLFAALSAKDLVDNIGRFVVRGGDPSELLPLVEDYSTRVQDTVEQIEKRLIYYSRLASIGILSAIIVHEVRNHTLVIGRLCRAVRKLLDEGNPAIKKIESDLKLAEKSIRSLERVADRFAPLASRAFATRRRHCILEDTIQECLDMRQGPIKTKNISIEFVPSSRTEVAIDPGELMTVLLNLLENSIYWLSGMKSGERRIEFRIASLARRQRVKVEVHDSGPGIEDGDEERIFWPGVTRKPEGLGMGLTVASEIIAQHGGKMYLIKPGVLGGASFGFDLPILAKEK